MTFKLFFGARVVLVAGPITFKFPRLIIYDLLETIVRMDRILLFLTFSRFREVFKENVREAVWTFRINRPEFLVPCILPFIIVNVYPTTSGVGRLKIKDYWWMLEEKRVAHQLPDNEFYRLLWTGGAVHTFKYEDNFAIREDGTIKMLDYGARDVKTLLERYPEQVKEMLRAASEMKGEPR